MNHSGMGVSVLDYSTDFPELPDKPNACASQLLGGVWNKPPAVRSERITQVVFFPIIRHFVVLLLHTDSSFTWKKKYRKAVFHSAPPQY